MPSLVGLSSSFGKTNFPVDGRYFWKRLKKKTTRLGVNCAALHPCRTCSQQRDSQADATAPHAGGVVGSKSSSMFLEAKEINKVCCVNQQV